MVTPLRAVPRTGELHFNGGPQPARPADGVYLSLAVERFETRRALVLEEANAIGTTYLRTQMFDQPHRDRISLLLVAYTDNRIAIATAPPAEARNSSPETMPS